VEQYIAILILSMLINQQIKKNFGFSLIELLVVISIIGVLSAVLVANFMGMRERARDAQKIQDLYAIKNALRMYYNDNQSYPTNPNVMTPCSSSENCLSDLLSGGYITSLADIDYNYSQVFSGVVDSDKFKLWVDLEAGAGNEDIQSQEKCGETNPENKIFMVCGN